MRLYTQGHEGAPWAWCAGFVSFLMRQAAETLGLDPPIRGSVSCDSLAAQARDQVMQALEELPEEQSRLLRIFYFEEKPHSQIASELGLPLGTVKSRLRLALHKLRVLLNGRDG